MPTEAQYQRAAELLSEAADAQVVMLSAIRQAELELDIEDRLEDLVENASVYGGGVTAESIKEALS